jgi:hypothetical protein
VARESVIERRIRAGLAAAARKGVEIRAIYLNPADRSALDRLATRRWGSGAKVHRLSFDDHPIIGDRCEFDGHEVRSGNRSLIYDRHGCSITIPTPRKPPKRRKRARASAEV